MLQQNTFSEGEFGDLKFDGLLLIGVYTDKSIAQSIIDNFIPVEYNARFGKGLQDLILTEIDSDSQLEEPCTYNGIYTVEEEYDVDYYDEELLEQYQETLNQ
jgi:hypothetical protein